MAMRSSSSQQRPDWPRLYEIAGSQEGYFTTQQAGEAGYSSPLLTYNLRHGKLIRAHRGIYRLVHFPPGDREDLVVLWLWSQREGVFSHETALALHQLSDALPACVHFTLPLSWKSRRLRVPRGVRLYHADIPDADRVWHGSVLVTSPARTLLDCARDAVSPELVLQAFQEGSRRGLFSAESVADVAEYLEAFEVESG